MHIMKLKLALCMLALIPAARPDALVTCNAGAVSVPVFNPSSTSGAVGDYTLTCTGGNPTPPGDQVPGIDVDVALNVPVLNSLGWILTDGVNMTSGILATPKTVDFNGVRFNSPGSGTVVLTIENILVDPSDQPPGFQFDETAGIFGTTSTEIPNQTQLVAVNAVPEPVTAGFLVLVFGAVLWRRRCLSGA